MQFSISNYTPPGPVAAAFIRSDIEVPFIMGPAGGGKTMATIFKALRYTAMMPPCKDGIIRAKGVVIRTDYRTLYRTTLSSWFRWFPKTYPKSEFTGGADRPATHKLVFRTPRGRGIELTVEFAALGDNRIEDVMRGYEFTWCWLNEVDLLNETALNYVYQRGARWPSKDMLAHGEDLPRRIFGDMNPPGDPDHWTVKRFIERETVIDPMTGLAETGPAADNLHLFQQPSGLSPEAENIANLPKDYYQGMVKTLPPWDVQRFVHGKVGYSRDGKPVYPEFSEQKHVAPKILLPVPNAPIKLGLDAGGHPAAIIGQDMANGQLRILDMVYLGGGVGPARFSESLVRLLDDKFRTNPIALAAHDPSALYGADTHNGEQNWVDIVSKALGVPLTPAPSNEPGYRIESVRQLLAYSIDAQTEALLISPHLKFLIKAFMSGYRYKLAPDGTLAMKEDPRPEKNEASNPMDALQYLTFTARGKAGVLASASLAGRAGTFRRASNTVLNSNFSV